MKAKADNTTSVIDAWAGIYERLDKYRFLCPVFGGWRKAFENDRNGQFVTIDAFSRIYTLLSNGKRFFINYASMSPEREYFQLMEITEKGLLVAVESFSIKKFESDLIRHFDPKRNILFTMNEIKKMSEERNK